MGDSAAHHHKLFFYNYNAYYTANDACQNSGKKSVPEKLIFKESVYHFSVLLPVFL